MGLKRRTQGAAGHPAAPLRRPVTRSGLYISFVGCVGLGLAVLTVALHPGLEDLAAHPMVLGLLGVGLVLGELRPIPISRGDDTTDLITISTVFAVALVLVGPLSIAIGFQILAVLIDDLRSRRDPVKIFFNVGQYVLTLVAARAVYAGFAGLSVVGPYREFLPAEHMLAALAGGLTFFIVNHLLISTVVALWSGQPVHVILRDDLRFQTTTSGVLVSLGPLAASAVELSPAMLPLLAAPVLAVHSSARTALAREKEAQHDPLTGLANRQLFREKSERALAESQRTGQPLAIMMIDLDHFKEINDTLGHHIGDDLIREVARRLDACRPESATVARLGGDEFALLLPAAAGHTGAEEVAARVLNVLSQPYLAAGVRLVVQASIGISVAPQHGDDVYTLMKRSDIALYEAKRDRARYTVYRPESDTHTPAKLALLADLVSAVDDEALFVEYQPKIDLRDGRVTGAEALVRWNHPTRGLVRPDEFIPLAENTGLIAPITWFVIDQALAQVRAWSEAGFELGVAVNLSVRHLTDLNLPDRVAAALTHSGVQPSRLTLEITESSLMTDPRRAAVVLRELRRTGVAVAIDDYGTGQASLTYLSRLDIDELKIDKSFIMDYGSNERTNDALIVRSTVELAHNLGLRVVAEGVESAAALAWLREMGCDTAQGYHTGRPMAAEAVQQLARLADAQRPGHDQRLRLVKTAAGEPC